MASIRKRGTGWRVQVRHRGFRPVSATFKLKADALIWAQEQEQGIDCHKVTPSSYQHEMNTVADILRRYGATVSASKRGADREAFKIRVLLRAPFASVPISKLAGSMIAAYRDTRLTVVKPATVRRELALLRHCLEVARCEWGMPMRNNPFSNVKLPSPSNSRDRRLDLESGEKLRVALQRRGPWYIGPIVHLAIETGMRRGELLALEWANLDLNKRLATLTLTKNGHMRRVPLTTKAVAIIGALPRDGDRVFPLKGGTVGEAWKRLVRNAGLTGFRFHDLRHEAISRLFEMGLSVPEVALVSGHRDYRMLFRYTHIRPEDVALKLP